MHNEAEQARFAVCVRNDGYAASLERRKAYQILPTAPEEAGFLRVIDESGDDYLYPAEFFVVLDLPSAAQEALQKAA